MKCWIRPRNVIALSASIVAGLLVWMLPPLADWTRAVPEGSVLYAVTSNGRYLLTYAVTNPDETTLSVWDRAASANTPVLSATGSSWLLSPDESALAVITSRGEFEEVQLFNLDSRQKIKTWKVAADHFLFSPAGELYYVKDRVLRDLQDGHEIRPLPEAIDGAKHGDIERNVGAFAIYTNETPFDKQCEIRVYSWLTGKESGRMKIPGNFMHVNALSSNGKVMSAVGWAAGQSPWAHSNYQVLADASGLVEIVQAGSFRELSPDGQYLISYAKIRRPDWTSKWLPIRDDETTFTITRWRTGTDVGQFRNVKHVTFSPSTDHVAVMRDEGVVEGYAWPMQTPWGLLAGAAFGGAVAVWSAAWLWTRLRGKRAPPPGLPV